MGGMIMEIIVFLSLFYWAFSTLFMFGSVKVEDRTFGLFVFMFFLGWCVFPSFLGECFGDFLRKTES